MEKKIVKLLDKGFIALEDVMGSDMAIINAARVSYLGTSKGNEKDKRLIFYLMKHKHTSPFEMVEFKFHVKCPLFVARQWMSHRTWSYNEVSRRYTDANIEFYVPEIWRRQSTTNKQGSEGTIQGDFSGHLEEVISFALRAYYNALKNGVAREQARIFLPQAMYTEFIAKVDARNLMHFLRLRMAPEAQYEIRIFAHAIYEHFFSPILPWTAEAFRLFGGIPDELKNK